MAVRQSLEDPGMGPHPTTSMHVVSGLRTIHCYFMQPPHYCTTITTTSITTTLQTLMSKGYFLSLSPSLLPPSLPPARPSVTVYMQWTLPACTCRWKGGPFFLFLRENSAFLKFVALFNLYSWSSHNTDRMLASQHSTTFLAGWGDRQATHPGILTSLISLRLFSSRPADTTTCCGM